MSEWIKILVEGGSVGVAIALIFYMWKKEKMNNTTMNNHLRHTYEAQKEETKAKIKLTKVLDKLANKIK
ncbi:hypothetical protein LCGC14_0568190 [marine sediment metagenome]|uniref:Uncharacterized protein n=1 Tax=marine sediment metagenome TaxID=412755 RepID=A0A0F9S3M9_9ZZZZ